MKKLSLKRSLCGILFFLLFFILVTNVFHLPVTSQKDLTTEETNGSWDTVGYVSDENPVYQSLYFHTPVRLHSMNVLVATYANTVTMRNLNYAVTDSRGREVFTSSITTDSMQDNQWLTLPLGDVRLRANERYFVRFDGQTDSEDTVCPTFYIMDNNSISDYLHVGTVGVINRGKALRATYSYDIVPMGMGSILFFLCALFFFVFCANCTKNDLKTYANRLPGYIWTILCGLLLFFILTKNDTTTMNIFDQNTAVFVFCALLLTTILLCLLFCRTALANTGKKVANFIRSHYTVIYQTYFLVLFVLQCVLVSFLYQKIGGWDPQYIWENVSEWLTNPDAMTTEYMQAYPNNIAICTLVYLLRFFFRNGPEGIQYHAVVLANVLFIDLSIYLAGNLSRKFFGKAASLFCVLFLGILMGISGYLIVPYTDTFSIYIPIALLSLYFKLLDTSSTRTRILCGLGMGMLAYWGYRMKPQCVIVLIAICCILALHGFVMLIRKQSLSSLPAKQIGICGLSICLGLILGVGSFSGISGCILPDDYSSSNSKPMAHFFMMGMSENPRSSGIGGFCYDDVFYTDEKQLTEERAEHDMVRIKDRLQDYGFAGYLNHLYKKAVFVLGDGSFYWQAENQYYLEDYTSESESSLKTTVRELYYGSYGGFAPEKNMKFLGMISGVWFLLLFCLLFVPDAKHPLRGRIATTALAIFGCVLFTLIFEGRSRYLILYLPLFCVLGSGGLIRFLRKIRNIRTIHQNK